MKYLIKTIINEEYINSMIHFKDGGSTTQLVYFCEGLTKTAEHKFPFFALVQIRLQLQELNYKLLCNGARIDVYPSGMSALGIMAYKLELGKPAKILLNIFDPTDKIEKIASVDQQKLFRDKWLKSI